MADKTPFDRILTVDLPSPCGRAIRHEPRKDIAAELRGLFRALGIKGVSVTAPNYSMAQSVDVRVPIVPEHERAGDHRPHECPLCSARRDAMYRIREIILAAFPDLDDRSDSMTDHFDYRFSVH